MTRSPGSHRHWEHASYVGTEVARPSGPPGPGRDQGWGALFTPVLVPAPLCLIPIPVPPCPCPRAGRGVGASNRTPGSPRGSGQHGGSVRVCGDTCAGGGDTCAGGGGGAGGGWGEPVGRWSLTDEEVALALPAVPQPVDKRVPDLSLGTQSREGERPPGVGGGPGGAGDPAPATLPSQLWRPPAIPTATLTPPPPWVGVPPGPPNLTWMLTSSLHCLRVSRRSTSTLGTTCGGG